MTVQMYYIICLSRNEVSIWNFVYEAQDGHFVIFSVLVSLATLLWSASKKLRTLRKQKVLARYGSTPSTPVELTSTTTLSRISAKMYSGYDASDGQRTVDEGDVVPPPIQDNIEPASLQPIQVAQESGEGDTESPKDGIGSEISKGQGSYRGEQSEPQNDTRVQKEAPEKEGIVEGSKIEDIRGVEECKGGDGDDIEKQLLSRDEVPDEAKEFQSDIEEVSEGFDYVPVHRITLASFEEHAVKEEQNSKVRDVVDLLSSSNKDKEKKREKHKDQKEIGDVRPGEMVPPAEMPPETRPAILELSPPVAETASSKIQSRMFESCRPSSQLDASNRQSARKVKKIVTKHGQSKEVPLAKHTEKEEVENVQQTKEHDILAKAASGTASGVVAAVAAKADGTRGREEVMPPPASFIDYFSSFFSREMTKHTKKMNKEDEVSKTYTQGDSGSGNDSATPAFQTSREYSLQENSPPIYRPEQEAAFMQSFVESPLSDVPPPWPGLESDTVPVHVSRTGIATWKDVDPTRELQWDGAAVRRAHEDFAIRASSARQLLAWEGDALTYSADEETPKRRKEKKKKKKKKKKGKKAAAVAGTKPPVSPPPPYSQGPPSYAEAAARKRFHAGFNG